MALLTTVNLKVINNVMLINSKINQIYIIHKLPDYHYKRTASKAHCKCVLEKNQVLYERTLIKMVD